MSTPTAVVADAAALVALDELEARLDHIAQSASPDGNMARHRAIYLQPALARRLFGFDATGLIERSVRLGAHHVALFHHSRIAQVDEVVLEGVGRSVFAAPAELSDEQGEVYTSLRCGPDALSADKALEVARNVLE